MDLFLLKKALTALVLPPAGLLVVAVIGLALQSSRPRLGRSLAWAGVLLLTALSLPVVSQALLRALEPYRGRQDLRIAESEPSLEDIVSHLQEQAS